MLILLLILFFYLVYCSSSLLSELSKCRNSKLGLVATSWLGLPIFFHSIGFFISWPIWRREYFQSRFLYSYVFFLFSSILLPRDVRACPDCEILEGKETFSASICFLHAWSHTRTIFLCDFARLLEDGTGGIFFRISANLGKPLLKCME